MSAALPHEKKARTQIVEFAKMFPLDVQIGAIEIKDHDSNTRANVGESAKANALAVTVATDDSLHDKIGEVQASPTANTLLDRLKQLNDWDESDRAKVNLVAGQAGITAGAGAVAANTPRTTLASDDPAVVSLGVMDDWDESDRAKVNLIVGQAGITAGAGAVSTNTPRVTHASDDPVTVSLAVIDDWDESDRAKVNLIAGEAGITGGAGAVGLNTPRMTLASDDPGVTALQVIDDWDESDRAKVNIIAGQAGVTAGAGAVAANTPRVTLASDDPAVTSLAALDNIVETNRAAVNPISGQTGVAAGAGAVGATTQRMTLASDDPAVALLGTINSGINTTLSGYVDGLEALITTLNGQTDTLEAKATGPTTGTITSVNDAATSTQILASNSSRKGATFHNESTSTLYLALSDTTASATVYSVAIDPNGYYELPVCQGGVYTGKIVGIWSADASGAVRVTELT